MDDDDGASGGRSVIRPAPAHIRTITTSGHITTVPTNVVDAQTAETAAAAAAGVPDAMSQLKAQQQQRRREFVVHDG